MPTIKWVDNGLDGVSIKGTPLRRRGRGNSSLLELLIGTPFIW
jgi:hypothetical protein